MGVGEGLRALSHPLGRVVSLSFGVVFALPLMFSDNNSFLLLLVSPSIVVYG